MNRSKLRKKVLKAKSQGYKQLPTNKKVSFCNASKSKDELL